MYISIDMDSLTFLHKHPSSSTVSDLDFIRAKGASTTVASVADYQLFDHLTDKELSTLYLNIVGQTPTCFGNQLRMLLLELADIFPVTDCFPGEVELQATFLERQNKDGVKGYFYVKGSKLPSQTPPVLFPKLTCTSDMGAAAVRRLAVRAAQLAPHVNAVPAAVIAGTAASAPARPAARPRSGVCKQIWEVLDQEKAAGRSTERYRIKELAVTHRWNASTASVQSALWRKANIAT